MDIRKQQQRSNPFHYNIKERMVRCLICDYALMTDAPAPKCETCGSNLITVIPSPENRDDREN